MSTDTKLSILQRMGFPSFERLALREWVIILAILAIGVLYFWLTSNWPDMSWFKMITGLFGGLMLFLFGMKEMEAALRVIAGDKMKLWLERFTTNRFVGVATGTGVTAIIQSSSVTTVLLVSFVSAGIMGFERAIPVILGANIGTTITAQLLAFKITASALFMIGIGFLVKEIYSTNNKISGFASVLFGLGIIFLGMTLMSGAMHPLREFQPFMNLMGQMDNPFFGLLVGAVFTALVQSSSATMGVIVAMASVGLINIEAGIALALGANVGTCVTAGLAAIGKVQSAVRVAVAHIIFNIVGSLFFIALIPHLAMAVQDISGDVARQVANAHTIFNIAVALLFLPMTNQLANLVLRLLPDKPEEDDVLIKAKYLVSEKEMGEPLGSTLALIGIRKEIHRMGHRVVEMYKNILPLMLSGSEMELLEVRSDDKKINLLNHLILKNIHQMKHSLHLSTDAELDAFANLWSYPDLLESAADVVQNNLVKDGYDRVERNVTISDDTKKIITDFHNMILKKALTMLKVIKREDENLSKKDEKKIKKALNKIVKSEKKMREMRNNIIEMLRSARLVSGAESRMTTYEVEADMVEHLFEFYTKILNMAEVKRPKFDNILPDAEDDMEDESDDDGLDEEENDESSETPEK